jgi:hypothetical protein
MMIDTIELVMDKQDYTYVRLPKRENTHWTKIREMCWEWCWEHKGFGTFAVGGHGVYFTDERDAAMFSLRWGS